MNLLFDPEDLIQPENHATRIPVVLCLDNSGSMTKGDNAGIDSLNKGVQAFFDTCKSDAINRYGFDVAIVTFGIQGVQKVQDFRPLWDQERIPVIECIQQGENCGTPLGRGIDLAMQGLQQRKKEYQEHGIGYKQPWLVIISDGRPTDSQMPEYRSVKRQVIEMQRAKKLSVIAIGVGEARDFEELASFVIDGKVLTSTDFSQLDLVFEFLSQSISTHSELHAIADESIESPLSMLAEELEEEGVSISIEDFGRDE